MKKMLQFLALVMVAVLFCTSVAFALDGLDVRTVSYDPDTDVVSLVLRSDYTDPGDRNFTVTGENGDLTIMDAFVLRERGTSWFVVLDYGRDIHTGAGDVNYLTDTEDQILAGLAGLVASEDNGALVLCGNDPDISVTNSGILKENLTKTPGTTDRSALARTLDSVVRYINGHRAELMRNVAVVVVTPAKFENPSIINDVERIVMNNQSITTHIISVAGSEKNYGADKNGWRDCGTRLKDKAAFTVGGTGYLTDTLNEAEAKLAVQRVREAERRLVMIDINPRVGARVTNHLTVTQTTAGGMKLTSTIDLPDDMIEAIYPAGGVIDDPTVRRAVVSTYFNSGEDTSISASGSKDGGVSTELIIGIVLGVVVLALIIVLVIVLLKRNGGSKKSAQPVYAAAAAPVAAPRTIVVLTGANGVTVKGELKNGKVTVGRVGGQAAIKIDDAKVSGMHMTLSLAGGVMTVTDNNSTNGVKVNGNKIVGSAQVRQNDSIAIGSTTYTISWHKS